MKTIKKSWLIILLTILLLGINSSPCTAAQTDTFEGIIVFIELDGDIYLLVGETNTYIQLTDDADIYNYQYPRFSPDGKMLAFLKSNPENGELVFDLYVMDLKNKVSKKLAEDVNSWGDYSWAPDRKSIVFAYSLDVVCQTPDQDTALGIFQVDVNTGDFQGIVPAVAQSTPLKEPVLSDGGNWIIYDSYPCFSEGWNIHTHNFKSGESYNFSMSQLDWAPGEDTLAWTQELSSGGDGGVYLVSADQNQMELIYMPENLAAASPHWSPNG